MLKPVNKAAQPVVTPQAPYCDVCIFCDVRDNCSACDQEWCGFPIDIV